MAANLDWGTVAIGLLAGVITVTMETVSHVHFVSYVHR